MEEIGKNNNEKIPRFNGVRFTLDGISTEELQSLKFGIRNAGFGPEISTISLSRQINFATFEITKKLNIE